MTPDELTALGFMRQSKTMWRKGNVVYQVSSTGGRFYRDGKGISREEALK